MSVYRTSADREHGRPGQWVTRYGYRGRHRARVTDGAVVFASLLLVAVVMAMALTRTPLV